MSNNKTDFTRKQHEDLTEWQRDEMTGYRLYERLADVSNSPEKAGLLKKMAEDKHSHYEGLREFTKKDIDPRPWRFKFYLYMSRVLGLTFTLKFLEKRASAAQKRYSRLRGRSAEIDALLEDQDKHENELQGFQAEERFRYVDAMVLGLNDALVEITGALAGLTLALRDTDLIALSALTTGIAAAMSMAASKYLSVKAGDAESHPVKAAIYTGVSYICVVFLLVLPYLILESYIACLAISLGIALVIIAVFNFYIAVSKEMIFKHRFAEMAALSMSIAAISFLVGYALRSFFGIEA